LSAAIELFGERGYPAVRMEDVGAVAGIAGPSIYQHFSSKADLLVAALTRGAEWLQLGLTDARNAATSDADALERVVRSYVEFAVEHPDVMGILLTESIYLPDPERHAVRKVQHGYVAQWVDSLRNVRPELHEAEARYLIHAVFGIVNDQVRTADGGLDIADFLVQVGSDVLVRSAP
jgi:AcrR family transcriptional regulator